MKPIVYTIWDGEKILGIKILFSRSIQILTINEDKGDHIGKPSGSFKCADIRR